MNLFEEDVEQKIKRADMVLFTLFCWKFVQKKVEVLPFSRENLLIIHPAV